MKLPRLSVSAAIRAASHKRTINSAFKTARPGVDPKRTLRSDIFPTCSTKNIVSRIGIVQARAPRLDIFPTCSTNNIVSRIGIVQARAPRLGIFPTCAIAVLAIIITACNSAPVDYKDASLPVDKRVDALLKQMTMEEKLAQLGVARPNCTNVSISTCDCQIPIKFAQ